MKHHNLFCRLIGHAYVYLSKAGQHSHRFFCTRCACIVQVKVPVEPKPVAVERKTPVVEMPKRDEDAPLFAPSVMPSVMPLPGYPD